MLCINRFMYRLLTWKNFIYFNHILLECVKSFNNEIEILKMGCEIFKNSRMILLFQSDIFHLSSVWLYSKAYITASALRSVIQRLFGGVSRCCFRETNTLSMRVNYNSRGALRRSWNVGICRNNLTRRLFAQGAFRLEFA